MTPSVTDLQIVLMDFHGDLFFLLELLNLKEDVTESEFTIRTLGEGLLGIGAG